MTTRNLPKECRWQLYTKFAVKLVILIAATFPQHQKYCTLLKTSANCGLGTASTRIEIFSQIAATTSSAYVSVSLIAKVINETIGSLSYSASVHTLQDGAGIAQRFFNRTFTLPTGDVYFSPTGQRHVDVLVKQYNITTARFEVDCYYRDINSRRKTESNS